MAVPHAELGHLCGVELLPRKPRHAFHKRLVFDFTTCVVTVDTECLRNGDTPAVKLTSDVLKHVNCESCRHVGILADVWRDQPEVITTTINNGTNHVLWRPPQAIHHFGHWKIARAFELERIHGIHVHVQDAAAKLNTARCCGGITSSELDAFIHCTVKRLGIDVLHVLCTHSLRSRRSCGLLSEGLQPLAVITF